MMIDRAIEFATKAHEGQFRKGTKRPYIVHPIEAAGGVFFRAGRIAGGTGK